MAEVLGIIASGIAVEQFAESVLKLKRLCSAFRNAPEDVTQLAEELDVIAALLVEVDGQRQQPYHTASSATTWERCVLACKNAGKASEGVIKVLETQLKTNRTLGGIRVAFKEAIAELRSRLERAKSTLVLAQQTYLSARLDYVFKTQLVELQNIRSALTLSPNTRPVASVFPPEPQEESTALLRTPYTCTGLEVTQRAKKPTRYRRKLLSLRIPNWISSTIWEAELTKISTSGWAFSLTSYAIAGWYSPVFQATFEGRLADLQYLFSSGQASPFLRDDTGATLLHRAAQGGHLNVTKFLLQEGADPDARFEDDAALYWVSYIRAHLREKDGNEPGDAIENVDLCRLLVADYGLEDLYDEALSLKIVKRYRGSVEGLQLIQNHIYPPYKDVDLAKRVEIALSQNFSYFNPRKLKLYLGSASLERSAFEHFDPTTSQLDLFGSVAYQLGRSLAGQLRCCSRHQDDDVEWRRLLREAVTIDAHWCAFEHNISPFCAFIQGWLNEGGSQDHTAALRNWILELQAADADILQYGEQEKRLWASTRKVSNQILVQPCSFWCSDYLFDIVSACDAHTVTTIINFACGPRSEDWQISLAPYQDEPSERHCDTVENGRDDGIELRIPGLWPKDEYGKDGHDGEYYRKYSCDFEADECSVKYFQLREHCRKCRRKYDRFLASQSLEQKRECFEVS